jgi:hypothetical protein
MKPNPSKRELLVSNLVLGQVIDIELLSSSVAFLYSNTIGAGRNQRYELRVPFSTKLSGFDQLQAGTTFFTWTLSVAEASSVLEKSPFSKITSYIFLPYQDCFRVPPQLKMSIMSEIIPLNKTRAVEREQHRQAFIDCWNKRSSQLQPTKIPTLLEF